MKPDVFKLEALFEQYERRPDMLVLGASDASSPTLGELFDLCGERISFDSVRLAYSDTRGDTELREVIARSYGATLNADNVLVTLGGSEAIFIAMHALVRAGDRALVPAPAYQPLFSVAASSGAILEPYEYVLDGDCGFGLDVQRLIDRIGRTRPALLVLNTPHNPTGHVIDEAALRSLLRAAKGAGTRVVVDEVFAGVWLGSTPVVPPASSMDPDVVAVGSLSKTYGLSGLRIGWLAGPADVIGGCRQLRHYTTIAPPLLGQLVAELAVRHRERLLERTRSIVNRNLAHARTWLREHADHLTPIEPQGGMVMLMELRRHASADAFARELADARNVFLVPCDSTFEMARPFLRLGLGAATDVFQTGLQRVSAHLRM